MFFLLGWGHVLRTSSLFEFPFDVNKESLSMSASSSSSWKIISSGLEARAASFIVGSNALHEDLGDTAVVIDPDAPFSFIFKGTASPHDNERFRTGKTVAIPRFL